MMAAIWETDRVFWSAAVPKYCFPWALNLASMDVLVDPVVVLVLLVVVDVLLVVVVVVVVEPWRH